VITPAAFSHPTHEEIGIRSLFLRRAGDQRSGKPVAMWHTRHPLRNCTVVLSQRRSWILRSGIGASFGSAGITTIPPRHGLFVVSDAGGLGHAGRFTCRPTTHKSIQTLNITRVDQLGCTVRPQTAIGHDVGGERSISIGHPSPDPHRPFTRLPSFAPTIM